MLSFSSFTLSTPALLFPTVSLLLLAYTNRFLSIASVIRKLHEDMNNGKGKTEFYLAQIQSLNRRIKLTVWTQEAGTLSLISCVISMIVYFYYLEISLGFFIIALTLMIISLFLTLKELLLSQEALNYILDDCKRIESEKLGKN